MDRNVYHIYDSIMKLIILAYCSDFLAYIGEKRNITKVLKTEMTTAAGRTVFLDFLCEFDDKVLCNIEFQFNPTSSDNLKRYFDYNIITEVIKNNLTESIIINFSKSKSGHKEVSLGESKSFHPRNFYLGDIDFEKRLNRITNKVENNLRLLASDELDLLLMPLVPRIKNKAEVLKKIVKILEKEELFDPRRLNEFKSIIKLEIENLLTKKEQKKLKEGVKMSPKAEELFKEAIKTQIRKIEYEAKEEGIEEGYERGVENTAKNLKEILSDKEIAKRTGLSLKKIKEL